MKTDNQTVAPDASSRLKMAVEPLLSWYNSEARRLPWRENRDPYRIWISEIMLQQTRVETVIPYFNRFLDAFPTLEALAASDERQLLKLWEGFGYYNRARNLRKAAIAVITEYNGQIPRDYQALLKLPGIGEYTAGSVASIAFDIPVPAVDGNVLRVFSRLTDSFESISLPATKKNVRAAITAILPEKHPGRFNQAIMELGALICLPRGAAKCTECPVKSCCQAFRKGHAAVLPVKDPPKKRKIEEHTLIICITPSQILLHQRPEHGLLSQLWEYPNMDGFLSPREVRNLLSVWQWTVSPVRLMQLPPSRHIFTHLEWRMRAYLAFTTAAFSPPAGFQWVPLAEVSRIYAIPSAFQAYTSQLGRWVSQSREVTSSGTIE